MAYKRKQPRMIKDLLDEFIRDYPNRVALKRGMILAIWPELIGKAIREQVRDLKFQGNRLVVYVPDPSWRHEIHVQRKKIADQLNDAVKEDIIRDIMIKA